jgi:sRNA-binding regulator protein Hfq
MMTPTAGNSGGRTGVSRAMDDRRFDNRGGWREHGRPGPPPETTHEEARYIKHLIEDHIPVAVRLADNQEVTGVIEYYDQSFIRLTRKDQPNLFIFKSQIKYLYEQPKNRQD